MSLVQLSNGDTEGAPRLECRILLLGLLGLPEVPRHSTNRVRKRNDEAATRTLRVIREPLFVIGSKGAEW